MPTISFAKNFPPIKAKKGDNLMQSLLAADIPVGSSCGGEGMCTKCSIKIIAGKENLSSQNANEQRLRQEHVLADDSRISCQTLILEDITIDTDYW